MHDRTPLAEGTIGGYYVRFYYVGFYYGGCYYAAR